MIPNFNSEDVAFATRLESDLARVETWIPAQVSINDLLGDKRT